MQIRRAHIKDTSKLEDLGFTFFPKDKYTDSHWRYNGIRVDKDGFIVFCSVKVAALEKFAELAKADLLEFVAKAHIRTVSVKMTQEELNEFYEYKKTKGVQALEK